MQKMNCKVLTAAYQPVEKYTRRSSIFMEQVTGHVIPDVRHLLEKRC